MAAARFEQKLQQSLAAVWGNGKDEDCTQKETMRFSLDNPDGLPADFITAYNGVLRLVDQVMEGEVDGPLAQRQVQAIEALLHNWRGKIGRRDVAAELTALARGLPRMRALIEQFYHSQLIEVITARWNWLRAELRAQAGPAFLADMQAVRENHPEAWPELAASYREKTGHDFDPAVEVRESAAKVAQMEHEYRHLFAALETDWPERLTPVLRKRLAQPTENDLKAWGIELGKTMKKLSAKFPADKA